MWNPSNTDQLIADLPSQVEVTALLSVATSNAVVLARLINKSHQLNSHMHWKVKDYIGDVMINHGGREQLAWAVIQPDSWQSLTRITRRDGRLLLQTGTDYVPRKQGDCMGYMHVDRCVSWHQHMGEARNSRNPLWVQMLSEANVQIEAAIAQFD